MDKPIYSWIDGMDHNTPNYQLYKELWDTYKDAENIYDLRFDSKDESSRRLQRSKKLQDLLSQFKQDLLSQLKEGKNGEPDELARFAHLVKANILLRLGLAKGKNFSEPTRYFQQACVILEHCYVPSETSCLNLLIRLALGKYFRSMGEYHQRNDYLRAFDEFSELLNTLEKSVREAKKLNNWEAYIWLETALNLSRTDRYLYRIRDAKRRLWDIFRLIAPKAGDNVSQLDMKELLGAEPDWDNSCKIQENQLPENANLYTYYAVQALVQLSIAYQKSCEYEIAQQLCMITLQIDPKNVDAMNNYAVCLQKFGKRGSQERMDKAKIYLDEHGFSSKEKVFTLPALDILNHLARGYTDLKEDSNQKSLGENRFATIRFLQARISEQKLQGIGTEIDRLLESNPQDQEIRLLKGLYLQKSGDLEGSQEILQALYRDAPQIRRGTIGLKAYYNIGCNFLTKKNFYEARAYFEKIKEESSKSRYGDKQRAKKPSPGEVQLLVELPQGDLLAQIDEGWCLMNIGDYRGAKACYEDILNCYRTATASLRLHNETRVRNNLAECCLQLIAQDADDPESLFLEASEQLTEVGRLEPDNATMTRHWGYYHLELGRRETDLAERSGCFDKARRYFEKVLVCRADDIYTYSGWISSAGLLHENDEKVSQLLENKLRYAAGVYSIKTCAELARFIEESERKGCDKRKLETLYRSLARINLGKNEEGYSRFQNLRENDIFRRLDARKRGELMAVLFQIYEQVLQIKALCRYVPTASGGGFSIPVHYTKIPALKALVSEDADKPGRLRLWNTVYMNDSFEGEHFINMLRQAKIERLKKENGKQPMSPEAQAEQMIENYFPYLHRQHSQEDPLIPSNDNTYICSFSEQKDEIHMWIPYADNAKGCALTFTEGFFGMRSSEDRLTDVASYSDADYPLYKVQYLDVSKWKCEGMRYSDPNNQIHNILTVLDKLWELLDTLELRLSGGSLREKPMDAASQEVDPDANSDSQQTNQLVRGFVASCLNDVRFLIKDAEYSYEKEIRLIHYSTDAQQDMEHFEIPRLFVEMARDVQIREVRLGSKIDEPTANAIVSWLTKTGKVDRITRSGRHYR